MDKPEVKTILFYGELPPNAVHGISLSNRINLSQLENAFKIDIIEEKSELKGSELLGFSKVLRITRDLFSICYRALRFRYIYFYLTLCISTGGMVSKNLFPMLIFRIFNRGKVVVHIHRGDFKTWYSKRKLNRILANLTLRLANKIIILSDLYRNDITRLVNKPVYVLHNTVDKKIESQQHEKQNSSFVFISNYFPEKGILDLLEVFSSLLPRFPDLTLNAFGTFPSSQIREKVTKYSNRNIIINNSIEDNWKFSIISNADCLILPSWNEGEPLVILEAMSCGTPVIASNVGLIPEMLGNEYPFLTIPRDKGSLEQKIIQFLDNKNLDSISKDLRERYNSLYSNEIHSDKLFKIFV